MIFMDSETCGLHGVPVIFQYAEDDGPVHIHDIWRSPIWSTLDLIERFCDSEMCFFNAAFDWFHVCKIYTMLWLFCEKNPDCKDDYPEDHIDELGIIEEQARFVDLCLKPKKVMDIMLHARKGPYQSLMNRDDIKIRRVPTTIAWTVAKELEKRIKFDDIYFAKAKDPLAPRWKIYDIKKPDGSINPDFKDIKLKFKASGALKNLYRHAFKVKEKFFTFRDVEIESKFYPEEQGYAPFALGTVPGNQTRPVRDTYFQDQNWRGTWPDVLRSHILHWGFNKDARKYAGDDVIYTRRLYYEHFNAPPAGDVDSELACMVAAVRWRGFAVNIDRIRELRAKALLKMIEVPTAPKQAKYYVQQHMDEIEKASLQGSTKKVVLEEIADWKIDCESCAGVNLETLERETDFDPDCPHCHGTGERIHPAGKAAREVLNAREAGKEVELYDKLLQAGRFHASFVVIGTLSSRMAGSDKLNPQGIKHTKDVRAAFPLADNPLVILCGGDYKSFEVSLAAAVFQDPTLDAELKSGRKIHALLGMELFPGKTYEQICASEGTDFDMYDKGKKGVFLIFYGGDENTFKNKLGIAIEVGRPAFERFYKKHPGIKSFGDQVYNDHACMRQPGGIGTAVEWHEPKEYAESFLGFKRYFTLEYSIIRVLFSMAQKPPPLIKNAKIKVMRRDRIQTAGGAAQSALYGAAFNVMSAILRAIKNHYIQSPGAIITKATQENIWTLQPSGINPWIVQTMNVHDELMAPTRPGYEQAVELKARETVAKYQKQVPLLAIDWVTGISSWAGKKGEDGKAATGSPKNVA